MHLNPPSQYPDWEFDLKLSGRPLAQLDAHHSTYTELVVVSCWVRGIFGLFLIVKCLFSLCGIVNPTGFGAELLGRNKLVSHSFISISFVGGLAGLRTTNLISTHSGNFK